MSKTDIIFLAKNRLDFTKASFESLIKNTNWNIVHRLYVYDDGSTDGTRSYLFGRIADGFVPVNTTLIEGYKFGGPASIMRNYALNKGCCQELFAKIDNDVIVPPNWLDECMEVMNTHPELDLLGIEPWMSRTPHFKGGPRSPSPELESSLHSGYARCDSIGGIGLMRRRAFEKYQDLGQHSIYGGFTDWQIQHRDLIKGWMVPPLSLFLLDRLPIEPWRTYSREYISKGWQRAWSGYSLDNPFWKWWSDGKNSEEVVLPRNTHLEISNPVVE